MRYGAQLSQSALNLAAARLRHIAGTAWSTKRYFNIELLKDQQMRGAITASGPGAAQSKPKMRKTLDNAPLMRLHPNKPVICNLAAWCYQGEEERYMSVELSPPYEKQPAKIVPVDYFFAEAIEPDEV